MMSGDVQPRKRKDKRRKKDELGVEEPRGTAAVFGEGDVLMHSHHEHSTGGHWCAKIIFFSLLSILVTLIVLIILENRGLTELEANSVESRYSGVLDGWIEDTADDDHHDEHTLDLKHHSYEDIHDDGDDDNQKEIDSEHDEDDHDEEEFNDENEEGDGSDDDEDDVDNEDQDDEDHEDQDDQDDNYDIGYENKVESEKNNEEEDDDEDDERMEYKKYSYEIQADENDNDDDDDENDEDDEDNDIRNEEHLIDKGSQEQIDYDSKEDLKDFKENDDDNKNKELQDDDVNDPNEDQSDDDENDNENEDDEENETENDEDDEEVERIEREVEDEVEAMSSEKLDEDNFQINKEDYNDNDEEKEETNDEDADIPDDDEDIIEPPIVEQIPVPSGKPFVELEDEPSTEKPTDTFAEEEEYEKRQEQIRIEKEQSSSQMWLKLAVGGALLLATHAVIRRSAAPGDTPESEDSETREETPTLIDRRMTLLPRETAPLLTPETREPVREIVERLDSINKTVQSVPVRKQESYDEDQDEKEVLKEEVITKQETKNLVDKELYSDEEEEVEDEEEIVDEKELSNDVKVETEKEVDDSVPEEVPDDVEIIDDEQIEEEIEDEEEDEEEISDVDDEELLSRLEAKYGRLPEPERPGQRHKDGGNSIEYEWPGEPSNPYWRRQLDIAEQEIRQHEFATARARVARPARAGSVRARYLAALALDEEAEHLRSNELLSAALQAYLQIIKSARLLPHDLLIKIATKTLEKIYFRGNYRSAEPVYRLLMDRFPNDISYRHNLTVIFLMTNNLELADDLLKETLQLWPNDKLSLAQYGFVLKVHYKKLEESVEMFSKALENDRGAACEPRFYYHFGDALLLLGRYEEANVVHKRAAAHGHFLSPTQRSLYNVDRLKSRPWWRVEDTPYVALANALERSWKEILKEGEAARALYEKEREGLKERGEWSQLDLFVRGQEILGRCKRAPVTCSIIRTESAAANCRRGQVKFSLMMAGTHVRPHVGPTNCRLRMHLGLSNTKQTYIRVDKEIRQWQLGKVLLFDDSFEHEVWHNGTGARLVLIVDVWHPDLSAAERRQLPSI